MYFKENLSVISMKNQDLALELAQMFLVLAEENIEVYRSETGDYVFSYEGLALDDMVNPKEDAALNFSQNVPCDFTNNDLVIVFGLGTGYLFSHVAQNTQAKIILWEPMLEILRYGAEFLDIKDDLARDNVYLASSEIDVINKLKKLYIRDNSSLIIVYPDSYIQLVPDILDKLQSDVTELLSGS